MSKLPHSSFEDLVDAFEDMGHEFTKQKDEYIVNASTGIEYVFYTLGEVQSFFNGLEAAAIVYQQK